MHNHERNLANMALTGVNSTDAVLLARPLEADRKLLQFTVLLFEMHHKICEARDVKREIDVKKCSCVVCSLNHETNLASKALTVV
jgi:hypothetical protein